jgi:hypothetical protein
MVMHNAKITATSVIWLFYGNYPYQFPVIIIHRLAFRHGQILAGKQDVNIAPEINFLFHRTSVPLAFA